MGEYKSECGSIPIRADTWSDTNAWYICALRYAHEHRGICSEDATDCSDFIDDFISDVYTVEGKTPYYELIMCKVVYNKAVVTIKWRGVSKKLSESVDFICGVKPTPPPPVGLTALFYGIGDIFHDLAADIKGIYLIGAYLAYPFDYVGNLFDAAGDAWSDFDTYFSALWTAIAAFLTWTQIKTKITDTWDILTMTASDLVAWIEPYLPALPDWLPTSLKEMKAKVVDWVSEKFEDIMDKVFK